MSNSGIVLYAEDDENDVYFMERAFKKAHIPNRLVNVPDGKLALSWLADNSALFETSGSTRCVVLLDLSMTRTRGLQVLETIRRKYRNLSPPVVVLTSSSQDSDIHNAYRLGASAFFVKPGDPDQLVQIAQSIVEHWLQDHPSRDGFEDIDAYRANPIWPA